MAFREGNPINMVGHLDTHRREADSDNAFVFQEQCGFGRWIKSEILEDLLQGVRVAGRLLNKEVDVARVSGVAVKGHRIPTHHDVPNPVAVKQPYKIAEVGW